MSKRSVSQMEKAKVAQMAQVARKNGYVLRRDAGVSWRFTTVLLLVVSLATYGGYSLAKMIAGLF